MKQHQLWITFLVLLTSTQISAQSQPFQIAIKSMEVNGLSGRQSYAWGQHDGKWLIIGGRMDGLHRFQPFASFDVAGQPTELIVIDPVKKMKWSATTTSLSANIQEQFRSTNMEFIQDDDYLYLVGGYGYSNSSKSHITYPFLSAINVPDVIDAIIAGKSFGTKIQQISDTMFAVTGGYLNKIEDVFYLTGGQKFTGRYNPEGPGHAGGFVQLYTDAIRKFTISNDGTNLKVTHQQGYLDRDNLHRRDYNVVPQIMPNGQEGLTAFSGVFQKDANLPYLNCVNIDGSGYTVNNNFSQYYNHYHCAHIPMYSAKTNEMHNLFFGGIAQYYDSAGILVQDKNVPFVKTIARVSRDADGVMKEYKLPIEMPTFLGAGSEFIPVDILPQYNNDVLKLDELTTDSVLLGYIYGGISSSAKNIFFNNNGTQSSASAQIFKVYLIKNTSAGTHTLNSQSQNGINMQVWSNPSPGNIAVKFQLKTDTEVRLVIHDSNGKELENKILHNLQVGENMYLSQMSYGLKGGVYFITLEAGGQNITQKLIVQPNY